MNRCAYICDCYFAHNVIQILHEKISALSTDLQVKIHVSDETDVSEIKHELTQTALQRKIIGQTAAYLESIITYLSALSVPILTSKYFPPPYSYVLKFVPEPVYLNK